MHIGQQQLATRVYLQTGRMADRCTSSSDHWLAPRRPRISFIIPQTPTVLPDSRFKRVISDDAICSIVELVTSRGLRVYYPGNEPLTIIEGGQLLIQTENISSPLQIDIAGKQAPSTQVPTYLLFARLTLPFWKVSLIACFVSARSASLRSSSISAVSIFTITL